MTSSVSYQKPQERERERESPTANDMSLWGAVPLHPRVRRTQGSEVAAGRAEEGPAEGVGWRPGGLGTVRKGSQLVNREPGGVWGCEESPEDCSHASQLRQQRLQLQPLSPSWQTGRVPLSSLLPSDPPRGHKEGQASLSCPGCWGARDWLGAGAVC